MRTRFKRNYFHEVFAVSAMGLWTLTPSHAAVTVNDTLTGTSSSYPWQAIGAACLTAGDGTGSIPACVGLPAYANKTLVGGTTGRLPDTPGNGALRLTNGDFQAGTNGNNQTGAVYSKFTFPSNAGVNITFKTVTYGGNGYGNHAGVQSGADGIAFFLTDASQVASVDENTKTGAAGGSLGYSCAIGKTDNNGLYGAYLGLGIDEYGNFSNPGDNTNTGPGQSWNRVSMRGAGNVNWKWLNENKPTFYPVSILNTFDKQQKAVEQTCKYGKLYDFSKSATSTTEIAKTASNYAGFYNYPYIAGGDIMDTKLNNSDTDNARKLRKAIFSQQKTNMPLRGSAKPITYNIKITQDGFLSFAYSYNGGQTVPVITKRAITASNGPLPENFRFGFSSGTGGGSNVHEIMCFKAEQLTGSATSAAGNVPPQGRVMAGSQVYIASYHPQNWWGQLTAQSLVENTTTGAVTINSVANWDASCKLTGGTCEATGAAVTKQAARQLFTWNASGVSLDWANLNADQQAALGSTTTLGQQAVDWLTGTRSQERQSDGTGTLRARDSLLGDIVNSSPTWVGAPSSPYKGTWANRLYPSASMPEGSTYDAFANTQKTRTHAVYVGANDGFLHAFRSGKNTSSNALDMTLNDGHELFAYMPDLVLRTINNQDNNNLALPSTDYGYNAFVDATPGTGDLYYNGQWKTWLVGGLGLGGNIGGVVSDDTTVSKGAIFALDITDPDTFSASKVIGEWNSDNLQCTNDTATRFCKDSLGSTVGRPIVRRLHDGNWAVIFPNGQNSLSGEAGIFVMTISQVDGSRTFRYLKAADPTRNTSNAITTRNGISQITSADLDGDHITDYVYAGDMLGNVWRFDLTSNTASNWGVRSTAIFNAGQPITTAVAVSATNKNDVYRVILNFGTGRNYPQTLDKVAGSATGDHYLYGIWDSDMSSWNLTSGIKYEALSGSSSVLTTDLLTRTITNVSYTSASMGVEGLRTVSAEDLCWKGSTTCTTGNNKLGWRMKLPGTNEQIFYNPVFQDGFVLFNTTIPEVSGPLSCDTQAATGFTMALPPDTGTPKKSYFKNADWTSGVIAGYGTSGVGSVMSVRSGSRTFGITQTNTGKPKAFELNPSANANFKRVTWIQRR